MGSGRRRPRPRSGSAGWTAPASRARWCSGSSELREALRADGVDHVVLAGMGGSSLAPEVIAATYGVELTVLDTTDPGQVAAALTRPAAAHRRSSCRARAAGRSRPTATAGRSTEAFRDAGLDPAQRIVVVTDPGLTAAGDRGVGAGYRVFLADPNIGGRYSALTAFGLVPTGLAGVPVGELLDQAADVLVRLAGGRRQPWRSTSARRSAASAPPATTRSCSPTPAPASSGSATGPSS